MKPTTVRGWNDFAATSPVRRRTDERVQRNAAGKVVLKLKTPWHDGATHPVMSPLRFTQRPAALMPRPRLTMDALCTRCTARATALRRPLGGSECQQKLRLVRHLPLRAGDGEPSLPAGRCRISLEGGNRGERHGGRSARLLWRMGCDDAAITLGPTPRQDRASDCRRLDARGRDAASASNGASRRRVQAAHEAIHRTPGSTSGWLPVMERCHGAGGARIEQSRKRTCNTTMAWPQCAHTKVGAGAAD
jgi:hypothetical protein